ncbi:hypothetical protein NQ317_013855 [Molorchus minor]|uniref:Mitochondrial cardiolipin hydrolase n=1 Tax=Molorchus minor TaxID=1323400 RepID=A0ABQ9IST9_9CUCU|nr:hypothetical protein NQ317_013855 [Molorchus minor]
MYLNILNNKFTLITSTAIIIIPFYIYKTYRTLKNEYQEKLLFYDRHNCVVMYNGTQGMSGWPPHTGRIKLNLKKENCLEVIHEPVLYFIRTAKISLDVAFMLLGINSVYVALKQARGRGVKIRLLVNYEHCANKLSEIKSLIKEGIEVQTYISNKPGMSSIMHYKYMVKDYTKCGGFVFTGSLNLSETGFLNNYEDIVFTSNFYTAQAFHENFEECWNYIVMDNKTLMNRTVLLDINFA